MADIVHPPGCGCCDTAREVLAELRTLFDPLDAWDEAEMTVPAAAPAPGRTGRRASATVADVVLSHVAGVLHRCQYRCQPRQSTPARNEAHR